MNIDKLRSIGTMNKIKEDYTTYQKYKALQPGCDDAFSGYEIMCKKNLIAFFYSHSMIIDPKLISESHFIDIIHHVDMDGDSSGGIAHSYAKKILEKEKRTAKISFLRYNYKTSELDKYLHDVRARKEFSNGLKSTAIITDLSLPMDSMEKILKDYDEVIWIDHHGTSLKVAKDLATNEKFKGKLSVAIDKNSSGAYMTYLLFCDSFFATQDDAIKHAFPALLISCYDTWNTNNVLWYTMGLYMNQYYFDIGVLQAGHDYWDNLLCNKNSDDCLKETLTYGKKLNSISELKNDVLYSSVCKYFYSHNGYSICIINGHGNSTRFPSTSNESDIKILVRFNPNDNSLTTSLFSENLTVTTMDLGRICRDHFNGGGHPGAAGFSYDVDEFLAHVKEFTFTKNGFIDGSRVNFSTDVANVCDGLAALVFYELDKELNK